MNLLIVTGLSGAGKSTALDFLEDNGYLCVDNLPVGLMAELVISLQKRHTERVALGIDSRNISLDHLIGIVETLPTDQVSVDILFLDARDDVLLRRYSQTRREHPLARGGNIQQGIDAERKALKELQERAQFYIDTSDLKPAQVRDRMDRFGLLKHQKFILSILSFGYKHGLPADADIVFDVRFIPNPFWIESMRKKTGKDADVVEYVLSFQQTQDFLNRFSEQIRTLLPYYIAEGKNRINIAIGCTGGQHRSVCMVDQLAKRLVMDGVATMASHRDLDLANRA